MKLVTSTLTSKGQTTIPREVRDALGLNKSDLLAYELGDGHAVLRPLRSRLLDLRGSVKPRRRPENFAAIRQSVTRAVGRVAAKR